MGTQLGIDGYYYWAKQAAAAQRNGGHRIRHDAMASTVVAACRDVEIKSSQLVENAGQTDDFVELRSDLLRM